MNDCYYEVWARERLEDPWFLFMRTEDRDDAEATVDRLLKSRLYADVDWFEKERAHR